MSAGIEAGGHGGAKAPPLSSLLQAVLTAIPDGPVVIAAGGVSTGEQIGGLLTQGAAGVALGTRFLFTHECQYSPAMKEVLVASDLNATERSMAFDEVNRTLGWPKNINGRAISNDIFKDHLEGITFEERLKRHDESKAKDEKNHLVIWAGIGIGITNEIKSTTVRLLLCGSMLKLSVNLRTYSMSCTKRR
jgi:nitronate monooxygenase